LKQQGDSYETIMTMLQVKIFSVLFFSFCICSYAQNQKIIFVKEVNEPTQVDRESYSIKRYKICTVDTDGSNLKTLSSTNLFYPQVFPSHSGNRIAFAAMKKSGLCLCTIDITGENEKIELEAMTGITQVTWSADDKKLLYVDRQNICLKELEGDRDIRLTNGTNANPQWLPDGIHCIYTNVTYTDTEYMDKGKDGNTSFSRLALLNVDSVGLRFYSDEVKYISRPLRNVYNTRISPVGRRVLAFADAGTDWQELMTMNLLGDSIKTVAVFLNFQGRNFDDVAREREVYKIRNGLPKRKADSANIDARLSARRLNSGEGYLVRDRITEAVWSPDGNKVACCLIEEEKNELLVMNADGSGKSIIGSIRWIHNISWSPDGNQFVYCSSEKGRINIMNADGSNQHALRGLVDGYSPYWVVANVR